MMKKSEGFTLIEIVVAVGVTVVMITSMINILLNSYRSSARSKALEKVEEEGSLVIKEIRRNLLAADAESITCPSGGVGDNISFVSRIDSQTTVLECAGGNIASRAASLVPEQVITLNSVDVGVSGGCANFVRSCNEDAVFPEIELGFGLMTAGGGDKTMSVSRDFSTKVVVRN